MTSVHIYKSSVKVDLTQCDNMEKDNTKLRIKIRKIIKDINNDPEKLHQNEKMCHVCKKTFNLLLQHLSHSESCKENYPLSKIFILRLPSSIKMSECVCKCCNKRFKITSILKHLKHKTKLNCVSKYTDDELKYFKETSAIISKQKAKKWRKKNKEYYASHRSTYYQNNKEKFSEYYIKNKRQIAKRKSDHYVKNQAEISKRHSSYYQNSKVIRKYHRKFKNALSNNDYEKQCHILKEKSVYAKKVFLQKLKQLKEDQQKYALSNKTIASFENEIESTFAYIERKRQKVLEKLNNEWPLKIDTLGPFGFDEEKFDIVVALDILTVNTIQKIEWLFDSFSSRPLTPSFEKRIVQKYCRDKNSQHTCFKKELLRIDKKHTEECHKKLREKCEKYKNSAEAIIHCWTIKRLKEMIIFFRQQDIAPDLDQILSQLFIKIDEKIPQLQSKIDEVANEVKETICHWSIKTTKKWKKIHSSDDVFCDDMFENLKCELTYETDILEHQAQTKLKEISRDIGIKPPQNFWRQYFFWCEDTNCKCHEFKDAEEPQQNHFGGLQEKKKKNKKKSNQN